MGTAIETHGLEALRAHLSPGQAQELEALARESDAGLLCQELLAFAGRLEKTDQSEAAAEVYSLLSSQPGSSSQATAQSRLDSLLGKGSFGGRAEVLLRHFADEATDPKVILPMLAGSTVYSLARTATLGRLAGTATASWYTRGLGARFAAAAVGFAAEVPTFALSSRALRHLGNSNLRQEPSLSQELASAGITLGLMKAFAFAGNQAFESLHGWDALGASARWTRLMPYSRWTLSQGSTFAGLLAAHRTEEALGLRTRVDGATTMTDTLASMLSMGVGAHLGHELLGEGFRRWQNKLELAAKQNPSEGLGHPSAPLPERLAPASPQPATDQESKLGLDLSLMNFLDPGGPFSPDSGGREPDLTPTKPEDQALLALRQEIRRGDLSKLEDLGKAAQSNERAVAYLNEFALAGHERALAPLAEAAKVNTLALLALNNLSVPHPETPSKISQAAMQLLISGKADYFPNFAKHGLFKSVYRIINEQEPHALPTPFLMVTVSGPPFEFLKNLSGAAGLFLGAMEVYSAARGNFHGWWHFSNSLVALSCLKLNSVLSRYFRDNKLSHLENLAFRFLQTGDLGVLDLFPTIVQNGKASSSDAIRAMGQALSEYYGTSKKTSLREAAQGKSERIIAILEKDARLIPAAVDPLRTLAELGNLRAQEAVQRLDALAPKPRTLKNRRLGKSRPNGFGPLLAFGLGLGSLLHSESAEATVPGLDRTETIVSAPSSSIEPSESPSPWWSQYSPLLLLGMAIFSKGKGDSDPPIDAGRRIRELKIELNVRDKSAKARRKSLDELNRQLMLLEQNDPRLPEGARVLRDLFNDGDDTLAGAAMEHYGTLILAGYQLSNTEIRTGYRLMEKIQNDAVLSEGRRKKAGLGLAYIEGGMELNDTAKFQHLEGTQPLPQEKPEWKPNLDRLNEVLLPLRLRKLFTDPETPPAAAEQTLGRYLAIVKARGRDLRYEVEMKELQKLFRHRARDLDAPGTPKRYRISLATQEEKMATTAFIALAKGYHPEDLGLYEAMSILREIFTGEAALQDPNLVHEAARAYVETLSLPMLERHPDWWQSESQIFRAMADRIRQQVIAKPSPWAQNNPHWHPPLSGPTDLLVLLAFAQLLRPLPTAHPALADGMRLLAFLAKRRDDVDAIASNYVQGLVDGIRQEKIAALPQPLPVAGWGTDPRTGAPVYVERVLDPRVYRIQEVPGPNGPQWEIEGPDLRMLLPKRDPEGRLPG